MIVEASGEAAETYEGEAGVEETVAAAAALMAITIDGRERPGPRIPS